jgi:hypothetical protein
LWGTRPALTMAAERTMRRAWISRIVPSQRRLLAMPLGAMNEVLRKVRNAPIRKEARETSVVAQAWGLSGSPAVERPRITVFPGNVLDKR